MSIKASDVRQILMRDLEQHARKWAGWDGVVSKEEEASRIFSWEKDTKLEIVREATAEIRAQKGPDAEVRVDDIVEHLLDRSEDLWSQFNQHSGSGKAFLSKSEVAQMRDANPELAQLTGKAWQSVHTQQLNERRQARLTAERDKLFNKPLHDLDDWKALSSSERESIVEDADFRKQASLNYVIDKPISELQDPALKAFAEDMKDFMEDNGSMEVEDSEYALIGPVSVEVSLLSLPSGEVVGGTIRFHQAGGMSEDGDSGYYDTAAEAEAAGIDTDADVQWDAYGYFDFDGNVIRADDYMEWSGH